jgi:hypothetical protein
MNENYQVRENAHAVVIGINEYEDPRIPNLAFARADAEAVYKILIDPELGRFSPEKVHLLLDSDATERRIRTAIGRDLRRESGKSDLVYIYYAGHGSAEIDSKCRYQDGLEKYLVPSDAELDNLFSTGIAMEEIQRFFERIEAKQILFFIDSCYSGEAGGRSFRNPNFQKRAAMTADFLDGMSGEGRLVVTACDVNEVSLETNDAGHGLFTYYLTEGLKGAADTDQDGLVTTQELYAYIFENVSRHAREIGGSMNPIQKGFLKGKVFLTRYETEIQKKAKVLHDRALALFSEERYEQAYPLWQEVIQLVPGHEKARKGLSEIESFRAKREKKRQQLLEKQQSALLSLYYGYKLSADELNYAIELIKRGEDSFSERDKKIYKLINDLVSEKISPEVYVGCVKLVRQEGRPQAEKPASDTPATSISSEEAGLRAGFGLGGGPVPPAAGESPELGAKTGEEELKRASAGAPPEPEAPPSGTTLKETDTEKREDSRPPGETDQQRAWADSVGTKSRSEKAAEREVQAEVQEGARPLFEGMSAKMLWIKWAIYMASGWLLATLIAAYLVLPIFVRQFGLGEIGFYLFRDLVFGVAIGTAQWLGAWRPYFRKGHWIGVTLVCWMLAGFVYYFRFPYWIGSVIFGGLIGSGQWLLLRKRLAQAWLWIIACSAAWLIAALLSGWLISPFFYSLVSVLSSFFRGIILACLTGLGLVVMVKRERGK